VANLVITTGIELTLADGGKTRVALSMYRKGQAFGAAAVLLNRHGESDEKEYVVLHLLCQSIEGVLKGLLLLKDYDKYSGRLKKPFGHNIFKIATESSKAFAKSKCKGAGINPMRKAPPVGSGGHNRLISPHCRPRRHV